MPNNYPLNRYCTSTANSILTTKSSQVYSDFPNALYFWNWIIIFIKLIPPPSGLQRDDILSVADTKDSWNVKTPNKFSMLHTLLLLSLHLSNNCSVCIVRFYTYYCPVILYNLSWYINSILLNISVCVLCWHLNSTTIKFGKKILHLAIYKVCCRKSVIV
jgi:hypothetical protein